MISLRRAPVGTWVGWCALAVSCLWAILGAVLYYDPYFEGVFFTLDEATGRHVAPESPLGLYYTDDDPLPRSDIVLLRYGFVTDAAYCIGLTALGAMLLDRNPRNRAGWLCASAALIPVFDVVSLAFGQQAWGLPWVSWFLFPLGLLTTLLVLILPDGRVPHPIWRPVVWLIVAWALARSFIRLLPGAIQYGPVFDFEQDRNAVLAIQEFLVTNSYFLQWLALLGVLHRIFLERGARRSEAIWIFLGALIFMFAEDLIYWIWRGIPELMMPGISEPVGRALTIATGLSLPVATCVAILRYRGSGRNPLAVRVLDYVILATVLTGLYLLLNLSIESVSFPAGNTLRITLVVEPVRMTVTAVGVALLSPALHRWLHGGMQRLVYGRRGSPDDIVVALGRRLAIAGGPDEVLNALADAVGRALPTAAVRVVLTSGGRDLRVVDRGTVPAARSDDVGLVFQGMELGRVEVYPEHPINALDRSLVDDLAASASAAVAAARRSAELQLAREQLVVAREQERRRIARDLHDGIGPVLSGLGFTLDALRATVRGTDQAEQVATAARDQVRQAGQLVRRVANQLRPPGVDQLGLLGALTEVAAMHNCPDLAVEFAANDLGELSAATEVAAYAIVAEAVTNVGRHSHATQCQIRLHRQEATLSILVADNGLGLGASRSGLGRSSMIERADELGGRCEITTPVSGGTRVEAVLPATEPGPAMSVGGTAEPAGPPP